MDETLRLRATFVDEVTRPLDKLRAKFKEAAASPGMREMRQEAVEFTRRMSSATSAVNSLAPAFTSLNLRSLSVGGAIAGIGLEMRKLAARTNDMTQFGREVGMTANQLRAWTSLGEKFEISNDSMKQSAVGFSDEMFRFRRRWSEAYYKLQGMGLGSLAEDMMKQPNNDAALRTLVKGLAGKAPEVRREVLAAFGLSPELSRIIAEYGRGIDKELAEIEKRQGDMGPKHQQTAKTWNDNWSRMKQGLEKFRMEGLTPLMGETNDLFETFRNPGAALKRYWEDLKRSPFGARESILESPDLRALRERRSRLEQQKSAMENSITARGVGEAARRTAQEKVEELTKAIKALTVEIEKLTKDAIQKQSFDMGGAGGGARIFQAALSHAGLRGFGSIGGGITGFPNDDGVDGQSRRASPSGPATGALADRIGVAKAAMMDELRKHGVPEANLKEAANLLTGQALAESKLNPRAQHDEGTGYGIYGARLGRRSRMLAWLEANGYARDSLEGQSRYMAVEAMSGRYPRTRAALMAADPALRGILSDRITREFESPRFINNRAGEVNRAAGVDAASLSGPATDLFGKTPGLWPKGWEETDLLRSYWGAASRGMGAFLAPQKVEGSASIDLTLHGLPTNQFRARTTLDGMFRNVRVRGGAPMQSSDD